MEQDVIAVDVRFLADLPALLQGLGIDLLLPVEGGEGQLAVLAAGAVQEVFVRGLTSILGEDWALTRCAYRVIDATPLSRGEERAWRMGASMVE